MAGAIIAGGDPERIAGAIQQHLDAGAGHARLGTTAPGFEAGLGALEPPAPVLTR